MPAVKIYIIVMVKMVMMITMIIIMKKDMDILIIIPQLYHNYPR